MDIRGRSIRLGPRIPSAQSIGRMDSVASFTVRNVPNRVVEPRAAESSCGVNACEKPQSESVFTLPIILGICIPVVGALVFFIYLQRRHVKKQREEDKNDRHAHLDFGLGDVPQPGARKTKLPNGLSDEMDYGEKGGRQRQVSMDLAMNSPYLLPPELQQSRESLHSLSRNIHQNEDPYNPVNKYYADGSSVRSASRLGNEGSSTYTGSSKAPSRMHEFNPNAELVANAGGMPRSAPLALGFVPPPRQNSLPSKFSGLSPIEKPANAQLPTSPRVVSMDEESDYGNGFQITPPSPTQAKAEVMRGQRYSMDVPPEEFAQAGLGAPNFDPRRLSMGFRPLPPNAIDETEDPELRANRIRSFYKEYFDESKPAPKGQYYEDYDQNFLGNDAAYYDPNSNGFVMPYAEPVTRRAMTPPPRGPPRFQGQGQPRGRQGSMGAMSTGGMSQSGMRGPPQMYPPGPYPQGPRAFSTASGRSNASKASKRAPPQPLNTLPTPSKLKDDSFAIMGSMEFAPPPTIRDRAAGRSESPLGERRPYSPALPAFVPTYSAYDELAPMPSPHLLRRSGTFTALDFAPPKKFRDADNMSDAGSIRSNRSGVSQRTQGAIRNGAYRVSRLPQDMVFTKDDMATSLKPQWGMRPGAN